MGISNSTKIPTAATIPCGGTFDVTLTLTAEPDILTNPTDIVLILDRSGSLTGNAFENMKNGAKKFIDIIAESTGGAAGEIGSGSTIGIVSFASTATQDTQLITSVDTLKNAVDALTAGGATNHADAFINASQLFNPASANAKIFVLFTDGVTTAGGPPAPIAEAAKAQGVIIYVIGLAGNGGIDVDALREWASDPDSAYVSITPDDEELEDLFEDLAKNITNPGATNIVITEQVTDCFSIVALSAPTKGVATIVDNKTLHWEISELGVTQSEGAVLTFSLVHNGLCSGILPINQEITYTDNEGNVANFGDPVIEVDCSIDVFPEACPASVELCIDGCEDSIEYDAGDLEMESLGRILQLDVTLKNVCPHKRVALAVLLNEVDNQDHEYKRGMKTMVIPAHGGMRCRDLTVRCIKFVLPEELDVSGSTNSICNSRKFRAQFIANYIDYDFNCCN